MAKADLGLKRTCLFCGMRYYDFNRTPIICPGCQTEFDPEAVIRSRRGRSAPKSGKAAEAPAAADVNEAAEEEAAVAQKDDGTGSADAEMEFDEDSVDNDIDADADDSAGLISNDLDEDEDILPGIPEEDE
ncbi:MAG: TIGR02300 family protein [Pseudomonadota bacterium]|nr:TIGR02300 family protein [Pseudomonadota bacterium]MEC8131263.1 TIGR02300 family protein [Pseudomonadota bacterium]